jgi:cellobiose phosphorylase
MSSHESLLPSPQARRVQLLGMGGYSVMLTDAGGGYSHWRDLAITRWREDPTCDDWGSHLLLRDVDSGVVWSASCQPFGGDGLASEFHAGRVEFACTDGMLDTRMDVAVAADCDAEVRRITLCNHGAATRTVELTSYAELVLGSAAGDAGHPAFSKLFVQTQWSADDDVLLATRRRRESGEAEVWAAHFVATDSAEDTDAKTPQYETDRLRFLGRGRSLRNAQSLQPGNTLSGTVGCVLDPVFSLRRRVRIAPGARVQVAFWTLVAGTHAEALAMAGKLRTPGACERAFASAQAQAHAVATQSRFGMDAAQVDAAAQLLAPLLYADPAWRSPPEVLARAQGGAPVLWGSGISGDRPIVLLRIDAADHIERVHALLRAQRLWRSNWLGVDIVLLNIATASDADALQVTLESLRDAQTGQLKDDGDGANSAIFALRNDRIDAALRDGLATAARVVLDAASADWVRTGEPAVPVAMGASAPSPPASCIEAAPGSPIAHETVEFDNGFGGFTGDGREYTVVLNGEDCTPAPWVNIIANPDFGCMVSAEGGGYSWSGNSQQNALTPWPNDPVTDAPHDVLYLRDDDSGALWSAAAAPIRVPGSTYRTTHGKGWSRFTHSAHGIDVELLQAVPVADPVKLSRLRLHNRSAGSRRLSITGYVQWALGPNGAVTAPFVVTELDDATGALFARNAWRAEYGEQVAFIDLGGVQQSCTGDRTEFLGAYGTIDRPAALQGNALSGRLGAGMDPCGALQTQVELAPDAQVDLLFVLGEAASHDDASALVRKYRVADVDEVLVDVAAVWKGVLDTVQVRTPDRALDVLLNNWLLYQTLGCRLWARTAYYQASGAYGFRDQLQDVMALCVARPDVARAQLLRSAARQFVEGDVQHWWLPPSGRGIRTRMTDDRLWLAYVAAHYIDVSGDAALLDESVPFIEGAPLEAGQHEAFFQPSVSAEHASVYEHGARAIDVSLALGVHGLPLIGTGDWNDGMNRVGEKGRGESVWLAWFLVATIDAYAGFAEARGEHARLARWRQCVDTLRVSLESTGWDGDWYRRGYYDDGAPLGSAESDACRIDTIAQSWSALAGGNAAHVAKAMDAVEAHLIDHDDKLAMLFTPPFEKPTFDGTTHDPGYIAGYPPGVRENGGQYTHGATWSVFAFAHLGQGERAAELFSILNPIRHTDTGDRVARYKVEPYVACADVYSVAPHVGRGGWTWYTGSAGWLYRAGLEAILGFRVQGDALLLAPCIPTSWPGFEITYRYRSSEYRIEVDNSRHAGHRVIAAELDGKTLPVDPCRVALSDDGAVHRVKLTLGIVG